ncbi:MAG: 3-phosphoshikimate 1-carboxyvinyltransferase [Bacteroidota bacterium]
MTYKISKPTKELKGKITLPSSKSISNRVLIIRALCKEGFEISNLSDAEDTKVLQQLLTSTESVLDVGAAGTAMRFLTAYLSIKQGTWILTGSERMKERPVSILVDALRQLGAEIEYLGKEGYPPLKIKGASLSGQEVEIDGSLSSQYISALLLIAPVLPNGLSIKITSPPDNRQGIIASKPYIKMTLKIMKHFGVLCSWHDDTIMVEHGGYFTSVPNEKDYIIEGDWSSASYWYAMVSLADEADLIITNIKKETIQGDAIVARIFTHFGVQTEYLDNGIRLYKGKPVAEQFGFDFSDCPDLAQTVIVVSSVLGISGIFGGLESLRIKETDRITALKNELDKISVKVKEFNKGGIIIKPNPKSQTPNTEFHTYNDHRMAMAFAPVAIKYGEIKIKDPGVVNKSYPRFWEDLRSVGFKIEEY